MGYLLKEALKTLCGVNQWSYAVFWKIGSQNPRLLIWEDCYYEPPPLGSAETGSSLSCVLAGDNPQVLVSKMMMDNHVNIVGEGLVGRVAFTGNYLWMLSDSYFVETHPPEVLKELGLQFAAGMQTVAVVPVLPHGVVQFGSYKKIMENMGFINDVMSLILQLGHVPGVLLSENYAEKELAPRIGVPVLFGNPIPFDSSLQPNMMGASSLFESFNYLKSSAPISAFGNLQSNVATFQTPNTVANHPKPCNFHHEVKINSSALKPDFFPPNIFTDQVPKAEVIRSNCEVWTKHHASSSSASMNHGTMRCTEPQIMTGDGIQGCFSNSRMSTGTSLNYQDGDGYATLPSAEVNEVCENIMSSKMKPMSGTNSIVDAEEMACENLTPANRASSELKNMSLSKMVDSNPDSLDVSSANSSVTYSWGSKNQDIEKKLPKSELGKNSKWNQHVYAAPVFPSFIEDETKGRVHPVVSSYHEDSCVQSQSGDDLFDVLGADFKNKLFSSCWNSSSCNEFAADAYNWDGGIFPSSCSDNLLEAVVSKVHPPAKRNLDDNISCKTTLTHTSSSSASPTASLPPSRLGVSEPIKGESFVVSKYLEKAGAVSSKSMSGFTKEDSGLYSQSSSIYASQVSSWTGKAQSTKQNNSGSNGYSTKTDETGKANRKRLKPGENPRPRPKDRQMIQDRVKELREIVPNGAKCSIDALLERTIKHMLFLQSVSKHGDKLKQIGESKIISKDGGLVQKEDFKGGATWAYEVGSQSVLCPIIVEDLNQPRQMLIEMFFKERGLFLEIADIIRGLGLTILKGIMETRNDKIWARFIVEANRDVTRMEIFLSLVRLLEQTTKTGASQPNSTSSENMTGQQLHQSATPPVGGESHSFQ